jgi:hypothetical protein
MITLSARTPLSCSTKTLDIKVTPVMMTYEEFYCGFTTDSHPSFSVSPGTPALLIISPRHVAAALDAAPYDSYPACASIVC